MRLAVTEEEAAFESIITVTIDTTVGDLQNLALSILATKKGVLMKGAWG